MTRQRRLLLICLLTAWAGLILACGGAAKKPGPGQQEPAAKAATEVDQPAGQGSSPTPADPGQRPQPAAPGRPPEPRWTPPGKSGKPGAEAYGDFPEP